MFIIQFENLALKKIIKFKILFILRVSTRCYYIMFFKSPVDIQFLVFVNKYLVQIIKHKSICIYKICE